MITTRSHLRFAPRENVPSAFATSMDPDEPAHPMLFAIRPYKYYRNLKRTAWILMRLRGSSGSMLVSNELAIPEKTLNYLGGPTRSVQRLIVAGKFLNDGRVAFIDRKNSTLLITNTSDETTQEVDLAGPLFEQHTCAEERDGDNLKPYKENPAGYYRENLEDSKVKTGLTKMESAGISMTGCGSSLMPRNSASAKKGSPQEQDIKPSDVNNGFEDNQLLVTYTGKDFSLGIVYKATYKQQETILEKVLSVKVMDRTRSIVVLDKDHFCATTQYQVVILNRFGDNVALHRRSKRDRGGLLMSDRKAKFFYGDGDEYVGCQWNGRNVIEIFRFRHPDMIFPRGSAFDTSGRIVVCCDSSHNIFRISLDGNQHEVIATDRRKSFGDVDFHPNGKFFVTTFWQENEWPIMFKVDA